MAGTSRPFGATAGVSRHRLVRLFAVVSLFTIHSPLATVVNAADPGIEFGAADDLSVMGAEGSAADPDVEIKGFTVFGATQAAYTGAAAGPGNVVVNGRLSVSSGAYFAADSTFTVISVSSITTAAAGVTFSTNVFVMNGAVGIGTTSPAATLDVNGAITGSQYIYLTAADNNVKATAANGKLGLFSNGTGEVYFNYGQGGDLIYYGGGTTALATFKTSGNVGIGTTSPQGKLDVGGALCLGGANCITYQSVLPNDVQTFDANGTWTKPGGYGATATAEIKCWGGGGGGGGSGDTFQGGGGGGGGGYQNTLVLLLSALGASENVTIGAGGSGGSSWGSGGSGGTSAFGAWLTASGGSGGGAAGGAGGTGNGSGGAGGVSVPNVTFGLGGGGGGQGTDGGPGGTTGWSCGSGTGGAGGGTGGAGGKACTGGVAGGVAGGGGGGVGASLAGTGSTGGAGRCVITVADNDLTWTVQGKLSIAAGNVGIGTGSPGSKLAVSGNTVIGSGYAASVGPADGLAVQGSVGIGTTGPGGLLDVRGAAYIGARTDAALSAGGLNIRQQAAAEFLGWTDGSVQGVLGGVSGYPYIGSKNNADFAIYTNNAPKVTIQAGGNVGIGTTNPQAKLEVAGDLIVANRANGMAYRTSAYDLAAVNTWYDIPLDGGDANLINVAHSIATNPERVTVNVNGTYLIQYMVRCRRQAADHHVIGRLYKNGVSEIPGSVTITLLGVTDANDNPALSTQVIASLSANDYITVQAGVNVNVANEIDVFDDATLPDPTTRIYASLTIVKIGP